VARECQRGAKAARIPELRTVDGTARKEDDMNGIKALGEQIERLTLQREEYRRSESEQYGRTEKALGALAKAERERDEARSLIEQYKLQAAANQEYIEKLKAAPPSTGTR
jgi:chromosome segregation ATPase